MKPSKKIIFSLILSFLFLMIMVPSLKTADAHFDHSPHYNGGGDEIGPYYAYYALEPEYAKPGEPTKIAFSVQDDKGNDLKDITTMVEIYQASTGKRIELFPFEKHASGDFFIDYSFSEIGNYNIVLSISKNNSDTHFTPPRSILSNTNDCECVRQVFNVSISKNFGDIWNGAMILGVTIPILIFGLVFGYNFKRISKDNLNKDSKNDAIKFAMMFLGIAGGAIHLAVYAEHSSLRIEYSYFLLLAGVSQIAFGILYAILILNESLNPERKNTLSQYRKKQAVNLCGLIGTGVLVGLYAYVVIFPPPLSPNNEPEDLEIAGIVSKSVEIALIIGITYLIRLERIRMRKIQLTDLR